MTEVVAGVDFGGTNTKFGLVTKPGKILGKASVPTDTCVNPESFFAKLVCDINNLRDTFDQHLILRGYGIGAPDANSLNGCICYASNLAWQGVVPVVKPFESITGLPATLINDANAAAVGERMFGVAKGMDNFIAITIGTGLGSGIVSNGVVVIGHDSHAGELGHTTVIQNGRKCGCGKSGCLESYVSAPGLIRTVQELLERTRLKSVLQRIPVQDISARHITEAARQGDRLALEAYEFTARILGTKLAEFVAFSSPEAIIFSGGLTRAGDILFVPTKRYLEENLMEVFKNKVKLIMSGFGPENAAILGAAASIWMKLEGQQIKSQLRHAAE
jgi:glucokinase